MSTMNLLMVDDEIAFLETMSKRLTKRNLKVATTFSGTDALVFLEKNEEIDVVILDVKMPDMDGIETLRKIKRIRPLVEVIMLTGHGTIESGIDGMRIGAFDYITKPCDIDRLIAKVREAKDVKTQREKKITQACIKDIELRKRD